MQKPLRPFTKSRYLRREGAPGGRVDLLWPPSACSYYEPRRTRQRAASLNEAQQWPPTARSSQCGGAAHRFGVVLACTDDSAHWLLSTTIAFATEGCCADQWSAPLEMAKIPGEDRAEERRGGARGAKGVRLTRGAGREHCSVRERPFEKASGAGSLARAFLFGGETAVIKGKVGKDRGRKLMKVHQDRLGETAQAGCAMRGVRHGALSSAKVKLYSVRLYDVLPSITVLRSGVLPRGH